MKNGIFFLTLLVINLKILNNLVSGVKVIAQGIPYKGLYEEVMFVRKDQYKYATVTVSHCSGKLQLILDGFLIIS